ncbi:MAG: CHAP domain-containing protein [Clostridia bacterium]|nr:CHAP domain-containing protein [Clostridia bacterium]
MSAHNAGIYANGYAWCDTFVDWCMMKAYGADRAKRLIHGWSAYTPTSAQYYKNNGEWRTKPQKGDQIFFKDSSGGICHTGLVYAVDSKYVYTVEGNTSFQSGVVANGGAVAKKSYRLDYKYIAGYGRPDYTIVKEVNKVAETVYNWTLACPEWSRPYVQKALDHGYIKGNEKGELQLTDTKIWCLVVMLRIAGIMQ